jgi:hypothetical protein
MAELIRKKKKREERERRPLWSFHSFCNNDMARASERMDIPFVIRASLPPPVLCVVAAPHPPSARRRLAPRDSCGVVFCTLPSSALAASST